MWWANGFDGCSFNWYCKTLICKSLLFYKKILFMFIWSACYLSEVHFIWVFCLYVCKCITRMQNLRRPEEGIRICGTRVIDIVTCHVSTGNWAQVLGLLTTESSFQPENLLFRSKSLVPVDDSPSLPTLSILFTTLRSFFGCHNWYNKELSVWDDKSVDVRDSNLISCSNLNRLHHNLRTLLVFLC